MERITKEHPLSQSQDLVKENIEILKELFPTIVRENQIDWDELRAVLGEEVISEEEYYNFTWAGKSQAKIEANKLSTGTLRPCIGESKNWNTTKNLYIEGDNLEVLKLLQKSYAGKIKIMYFDPPYNTGKEFVYKDDYSNNLSNYLELTNQIDETGAKIRVNTESEGRFHSNWLNMMYPRLKLSRNLLSNDGVIFISIDDNEVANLRKLCNEVFGEENFVAQIIWERAYSPVNLKKHFSENHDYLVCYSKSIDQLVNHGLPRTEEANSRYSNPDNDPRGVWKSSDFSVGPEVKEKIYPINLPSGRVVLPPKGRCWVLTKERYKEFLDDERIWFGESGNNVPSIKRFLSEVKDGITPLTIWKYSEVGHSQEAAQNLKLLFDDNDYFDYPKPVGLIKRCLELYSDCDSLVLDIFSGSATTAHSVIQHNSEDGGDRRFILVQLPEPLPNDSQAFHAGLKSIADIGKKRIRRAGEKILSDLKTRLTTLKESIEGKMLQEEKEAEIKEFEDIIENLDVGFRVFKLDTSNILAWDGSVENLEENLLSAVENIKPDRTEEDVLFEILLKYGIDLAQPVEEKVIAGCKVFSIGAGVLFVCLSDKITTSVADGIGAWKNELNPAVSKVVFKDSGFAGDVDKTNAIQILKRFGITDVKSI
jgi:adenine-specific DNA-methyltransferase